jgi:hypothetical protein
MKTTSSPGKTGGNFYGLGTYLGLAGALLAMIALFSVSAITFCPMTPSAPWPTRFPT